MAKLIIDIYMSKLVDFSTILKFGEIISQESDKDEIIIVCYMGSVHTRAICDFFSRVMAFKKSAFYGRQDWGDEEARVIHVPAEFMAFGLR